LAPNTYFVESRIPIIFSSLSVNSTTIHNQREHNEFYSHDIAIVREDNPGKFKDNEKKLY